MDADGIVCCFVFFFNDTATTEIYTLSLHDALPISLCNAEGGRRPAPSWQPIRRSSADRKSTRLNSSHSQISYAVFCLKKNDHRDAEEAERDTTLTVVGATVLRRR